MFEFSWDVHKKKFFDHERMKQSMQDEMSKTLNDYAITYHTDRIKEEVMEELQGQYQNALRVVGNIKQGLLLSINSMNILAIKPY